MATAEPVWASRVGRKFKVVLRSGEEFTSDVFGFDNLLSLIIFRLSPHHTYQKADYRLVPTTSISSAIDVGQADAVAPYASLPKAESDRRLADAERAELDRQSKRGVGVSPLAQAVFDFINKTMRSAWSGDIIVVTEKIAVSPPYTAQNVQVVAGADPAYYAQQVDRIRMIVERARAAFAASSVDAPAAATAAAPLSPA